MSDTQKNLENQIQIKATLLARVLEKHNPSETADIAFALMENTTPGTQEFKAYAALYELMDILK
jgi:hypothetical protein